MSDDWIVPEVMGRNLAKLILIKIFRIEKDTKKRILRNL